ncbi:HDOD domain-containing protein [Colwellia sp. MEBiC06753]
MQKTPQDYALEAQELCVLPDIYLKLSEMLAKDDCTLDELAEVIKLEPAIASTLLKIANSAMFNFPREIDNISKALLLLGLKEVSNLVNAYGVTAAFSGVNPDIMNLDKFWEISVDCALICQYFAKEKKIANRDSIFLSGLFHNLGELAIVHIEPSKVQFCESYSKTETPWQRQSEAFGFTFADVSAALLELWQLPASIIKPITDFNNAYQDEVSEESNLLYVASRLAILNAHPGMYSKKTFVGQHILDDLGINAQDIDDALEYCNAKALELINAFPIIHS